MSPRKLKVIVSGYIATTPFGGKTWHCRNYIHCLQELGHDVVFLEDLLDAPFNPVQRWLPDGNSYGLRFLEEALSSCERPVPFAYHSKWDGRWYGLDREQLKEAMTKADIMVCVDAGVRMRREFPRPRLVIAIDVDPVYTQLRMLSDPDYLEHYRQYDAVATFGESIGTSTCRVPTHGFAWIPTRQPVSLRHWPVVDEPSAPVFATLTTWSYGGGEYPFEGQIYRFAKDEQWCAVLDLPRRVPWHMEIAVETSGSPRTWGTSMPYTAQQTFRDRGWRLSEPLLPSLSGAGYREFISRCSGEFTVAKDNYVGVPSGWFGDRSPLFLSSGKPVVVQETGFSHWLPTGEGLFSFVDVAEAAGALQEIARDYSRHARSARRIAEEYFDGRKVLQDLLNRVL